MYFEISAVDVTEPLTENVNGIWTEKRPPSDCEDADSNHTLADALISIGTSVAGNVTPLAPVKCSVTWSSERVVENPVTVTVNPVVVTEPMLALKTVGAGGLCRSW